AFLAGGEVDVGVRPLPGPVVFGAVEAGGAQPVLQREFVTVPDTHPPLLGAVDEKESAERPVRLAADVGRVLLVDDQDRPAAVGQFACRDQTGQPGANHDDISSAHVRSRRDVSHDANLSTGCAYAASVSAA